MTASLARWICLLFESFELLAQEHGVHGKRLAFVYIANVGVLQLCRLSHYQQTLLCMQGRVIEMPYSGWHLQRGGHHWLGEFREAAVVALQVPVPLQ